MDKSMDIIKKKLAGVYGSLLNEMGFSGIEKETFYNFTAGMYFNDDMEITPEDRDEAMNNGIGPDMVRFIENMAECARDNGHLYFFSTENKTNFIEKPGYSGKETRIGDKKSDLKNPSSWIPPEKLVDLSKVDAEEAVEAYRKRLDILKRHVDDIRSVDANDSYVNNL
jgi:hypothetical protein